MYHGSRRGSILLLCITIVATLTVIAYAFVRTVQLNHDSGDSVTAQLLAREAAIMGFNHAIEQIQRDYINEPFTRMDGPARAPFVSHVDPYYAWHGSDAPSSQGTGIDLDDVGGERSLYSPIFGRWGQMQYNDGKWFHSVNDANNVSPDRAGGLVSYDGRGRYYEPGFLNRATVGGDYTATQATVPVTFSAGIANPTSIAVPDRSEGLWLDEHWQRVDGVDAREKRARARYRLRYAVGVMDLDGELLVTGDPAVDASAITVANPGLASTAAAARVIRYQHAVAPIIGALNTTFGNASNLTNGVRVEHVFTGRGSTANFDRDATLTPSAPLAFPLMYRWPAGSANIGFHHQMFAQDTLSNNATPGLARDLFSSAGSALLPSKLGNLPMKRSLLGSQVSFKDLEYAIFGNLGDSDVYDGYQQPLGSLTPFGRGLRKETSGSFISKVDTPWRVNIMTAPVQVIQAMIAGYMPRGGFLIRYKQVNNADRSVFAPLEGSRDLFVRELFPAFDRYQGPSRLSPLISPDYHLDVDCSNDPGYRTPQNRYPGMLAYNGYFPAVTRDPITGRVIAATAQPNSSDIVFWSDMLGRYLRRLPDGSSADRGVGLGGEEWASGKAPADPYSGGTMWRHSSGQAVSAKRGTHRPDGNASYDIWAPGSGTYAPHPFSIWEAIGEAMSNTVAITRAQWNQYPTTVTNPTTNTAWQGFDGSLTWPGTKVQSIRDIDALFLANLGSDIDNPTNTTPTSAWRGDMWNGYRSFTPLYNLASLRTANNGGVYLLALNDPAFNPANLAFDASHPMTTFLSSISLDPASLEMAGLRSQAIEMIVNDFRLSFFGASPGYDDFMPLDLNGDGKVNCSGFPANGVASAQEVGCGLDQWAAPGTSVADDRFFSIAGVFFMGKSRFWRVMVRGEVWDSLLAKTISETTLDSVIAVDPVDAANELDPDANLRRPAAGQYATHVIHQRWFFNLYRANLSRRQQ